MECRNCNYFKINPFIFDDGTQTMECIKYNSFLGFTTSTGKVTEPRKNDHCIDKEVLSKPIQESLPKSNIRGITWDKNLRKKVHLGQHKDLDKAIKILEDWLKRGENG